MTDIFKYLMSIFINLLQNSFFQGMFFLPVAVFFFLWACSMIKRGFEP